MGSSMSPEGPTAARAVPSIDAAASAAPSRLSCLRVCRVTTTSAASTASVVPHACSSYHAPQPHWSLCSLRPVNSPRPVRVALTAQRVPWLRATGHPPHIPPACPPRTSRSILCKNPPPNSLRWFCRSFIHMRVTVVSVWGCPPTAYQCEPPRLST